MKKQKKTPKPIDPRLHGLIDYGFAATNLLVPKLLRMPKRNRRLFAAFGLIQGGLNAVTAQPNALVPDVPFAVHGKIEKVSTPIFVVAPLLLRTHKSPKGMLYWLLTGVALVAVYNLTDWDAQKTSSSKKKRR